MDSSFDIHRATQKQLGGPRGRSWCFFDFFLAGESRLIVYSLLFAGNSRVLVKRSLGSKPLAFLQSPQLQLETSSKLLSPRKVFFFSFF